MDTKPEEHGHGGSARPMELVLMAMGGCSGIDIEVMLGKMRIKLSDFHIHLKGVRADSKPRVHTKIHVEYHFWGRDLPREKLKRAVKLSDEKYCSVSSMLNKVATVTTEVILHPED